MRQWNVLCHSCTERSSCSAGTAEVGWLDSRCPHVIELTPSQIHVDFYSNTSVCHLLILCSNNNIVEKIMTPLVCWTVEKLEVSEILTNFAAKLHILYIVIFIHITVQQDSKYTVDKQYIDSKYTKNKTEMMQMLTMMVVIMIMIIITI